MRRREFLSLLAGTSVLQPVRAGAQQSAKVYRIAILHPSHPVSMLTATSSLNYYRAFFEELQRLGYTEGQNLSVERHSAEGHLENYEALVQNVVRSKPDLVLVVSNQLAKLLKEATLTIPIVALTSDPIDAGLVASLARPGANLTGVSGDPGLEIWGRRFQLFREVIPTLSKVGILTLRGSLERDVMLRTAASAGITVVGPSDLENSNELDYRNFFAAASHAGAEALFVGGSIEHITKRQLIVELAAKFRLPAIYVAPSFAEAGGLMSYGPDAVEMLLQCARSIDKILKGSKPGDIPYYLPIKFELVINLGTANALGLAIPDKLLSTADEVIE